MSRISFIMTASAVVAGITAMNAGAQSQKTLVAYFSATGTTERAARMIAEATGGTIYEIYPEQEYTSADLDWRNSSSRSSIEMNDSGSRPAIKADLKDADSYDVIYIGYPIWWNLAPRVIYTFLDTYGFSGKTVVPFATSGGSNITNSINQLKKEYPAINWQNGRLLNDATETSVREWVKQVL